MSAGHRPDLDARIAALAADAAPGVIDAALAEARRRAADVLAERLTEAIVSAALATANAASAQSDAVAAGSESANTAAPQGDAVAAAPTPAEAGTGIYAYTATAADLPDLDIAGLDGAPVRVLRHEGLALVVSDLELARLDGLTDLDGSEAGEEGRLADLVRRHDAVVTAAFDAGSVVPLRFGTVLRDEAAARRLLAERRDALVTTLRKVAGHTEWGVRVLAGEPTPQAGAHTETAGSTSGTAYLRSRQEELSAAETRRDARRAAVDRARGVLAGLADDTALGRGGGDGVLLAASFLVPDDRDEQFRAVTGTLAQELSTEGLALAVTGPWPPYSFARVDLGEIGG